MHHEVHNRDQSKVHWNSNIVFSKVGLANTALAKSQDSPIIKAAISLIKQAISKMSAKLRLRRAAARRAGMGAQIKAVPGWGEYFSKVYLLRPKIRCNSPHSRPVGVSPTWERARGVQAFEETSKDSPLPRDRIN